MRWRHPFSLSHTRPVGSDSAALIENPLLVPATFVVTVRALADMTKEIQRRRTVAIISHKTTLTEKLLLYGGAVQLAGSVTARS